MRDSETLALSISIVRCILEPKFFLAKAGGTSRSNLHRKLILVLVF